MMDRMKQDGTMPIPTTPHDLATMVLLEMPGATLPEQCTRLAELVEEHPQLQKEVLAAAFKDILGGAARRIEREKFYEGRRQDGLAINPDTAEVAWEYGQTMDPYGVEGSDLPEELHCVGREYFARDPVAKVWVSFGDLPQATRDALWAKHEATLAVPPSWTAAEIAEDVAWEQLRAAAARIDLVPTRSQYPDVPLDQDNTIELNKIEQGWSGLYIGDKLIDGGLERYPGPVTPRMTFAEALEYCRTHRKDKA
jgi:hypothetical protein